MLVQSMAAGDQLALHALYEMAHRIVFTLTMRITANRETAEELTIDVFHDVCRGALGYDGANGTVPGVLFTTFGGADAGLRLLGAFVSFAALYEVQFQRL